MSTAYSSNQLHANHAFKSAISRVISRSWKYIAFLIFIVLMGMPVLAVFGHASPSSATASRLFTEGTWVAFKNSVTLGILVAIVSTVIAYGLAFAMDVTGLAANTFARIACLIPFMGPPYLMSIGWILFMDPNGYLDRILPFMSHAGTHFFSLWGLVCVMSLHLFPIPFLSALQSVWTIRRRYDAPAKTHGASAWYRVFRIWLPIGSPLLVGSLMLVFVKTIGEFGTPLVFGSLLHFPVLTTTIYLRISSWPIDFSAAAKLSTLLLLTVFVAWLINDRYQRKTHAVVGKALAHQHTPKHRVTFWLSLIYIVVIALVSIGIPFGSLLVTSLLRVEGLGIHWSNLSFIHYAHAFAVGSDGLSAVITSLELAIAAATVTLVLSVALAALTRFYPTKLVRFTEWLGLLPNSIPDVLLVLGLILFWNARRLPVTPYNTNAILVLGFVVVLFPFSFNYVKVALFRLSPNVWESALVHQASRVRITFKVVLPLIASGMVSGWIMVFGISLRDLVVPMLLSPPNTTVISTYIYGQYDQGSLPNAMALAVVTLVLTIVILGAVQWVNARTLGDDQQQM